MSRQYSNEVCTEHTKSLLPDVEKNTQANLLILLDPWQQYEFDRGRETEEER